MLTSLTSYVSHALDPVQGVSHPVWGVLYDLQRSDRHAAPSQRVSQLHGQETELYYAAEAISHKNCEITLLAYSTFCLTV